MFDTIRLGAAGAGGDYEIERSLRFNYNDTPKLTWTPSSNTNAKTFTLSFWFKIGVSGRTGCIFEGNNTNANGFMIAIQSDGTLYLYDAGVFQIWSVRVFRDPSSWYHCVVAMDTTQGTDTNRVKVYINGVQEDLSTWNLGSGANRYPPQNNDLDINQTNEMAIGESGWSGNDHWDGYIAEFHSIDGTQLAASSFGETNTDTGQWVPKKYAGSYGTNGFYLNFSDNSNTTSGTLGDDDSANTNDWTPTNLVTGDSVVDTPTNNFATLRMLRTPYASGASITDGNLRWISSSGTGGGEMNKAAISTMLVNSGKWYAEFYSISGTSALSMIGVQPYEDQVGGGTDDATLWGAKFGAGDIYIADHAQSYPNNYWTHGSAGSNGDITMVYFDMDVSPPRLYTGKNGQWADGSGNDDESSPNAYLSLGNNIMTHNASMKGYLGFRVASGGSAENCGSIANFGQDSTFAGSTTAGTGTDANGYGNFKYAPPTGALALCTANLPTPTIVKPSDYFNTVLYTGNGGTQSITSLDFQPDLVWNKNRDASTNHNLTDSVRGVSKKLLANTDDIQADQSGDDKGTTAFLSNGFTVKDDASGNYQQNGPSGNKFVAWCWKESATAGFDIVSYTGTGSNPQTRAHSLGVAPEMIIVKTYTGSTDNWSLFHHRVQTTTASSATYWGSLNTDNDFVDHESWNDTVPTSSIFTTQNHANNNLINDSYIAYLFASVEGYSKVGAYIGNGNADGPFVYTGFKPAFVLWKDSDNTRNWHMIDNKRDTNNPVDIQLYPNLHDGEYAETQGFDFLSNGFKVRESANFANNSTTTYIFLAFAERPFKYANAG